MSRVLIVEDEEAIAEIEKDYLELSDFEVVIKSDGTQGLATALNEDFDIMILDVMLPGMDGFELLEIVKQYRIPVIFLTAKDDIESKTHRLSWYRQRKKTLIKSADWVSAQMII